MILADQNIRARLASGQLGINPYDDAMIQPASVDVRLDHHFRVFIPGGESIVIDPSRPQDGLTELITTDPGKPFILRPHEFTLASTFERLTLPDDLAGRIEGKSSLGRLGLMVHSTAGFIDPGFSGTITLELSNATALPIVLWPGMRIGQLCLLRLISPAQHPYGSDAAGSRYQHQLGPTASRAHLNFDLVDTHQRKRTATP